MCLIIIKDYNYTPEKDEHDRVEIVLRRLIFIDQSIAY